MLVLALALASAVTVELHSAKGLDASDQAVLSREVARAVERVTGAPPGLGADVSVAIDAHRIGGRIRVEAERRDKQRLVRRAEADLTRDTASWSSPRATTRKASGESVSSTRIDTLRYTSRCRRSRMLRDVTYLPSRPA